MRYAVLACAFAGLEAPERELRRMGARLRAPADARDLALLVLRNRERVEGCAHLDAEALMSLFQSCDALRRPARVEQLLQALACCGTGQAKGAAAQKHLRAALRAARSVDAGAIARRESEPQRIAARLRSARVAAIRAALRID